MQINTYILQLYKDLYMIFLLQESQLHSLCCASAMFQIPVSLLTLPGVDPLSSSWAAWGVQSTRNVVNASVAMQSSLTSSDCCVSDLSCTKVSQGSSDG